MKVKQLIAELQKLDPDLYVVTSGYEGGYDDIEIEMISSLVLNHPDNTAWYYGNHGTARTDKEKESAVPAVCL